MTLNPSRRVRAVIYIITLTVTPLVAYLRAKGFIGDLEVALWGNEVTAAGTLALVNTRASETPPPDTRPIRKAAG